MAIAAATLRLMQEEPDAVVAFFPYDHHYTDEEAFLDVVESGCLTARNNPNSIVLLGAEPTYPETEYGWIEPVQALPKGFDAPYTRVRRFWEKPSLSVAQELLLRVCLWNTFVTIGRASAFIDLLQTATPNALRTLSAGIRAGRLDASYGSIPSVDFSRGVLACQPERLLVIRDVASGWTDLGSPRRVFDAVARQGTAPTWVGLMPGSDVLPTG